MTDSRAFATVLEPVRSETPLQSRPSSKRPPSSPWFWKGVGAFVVLALYFAPLMEVSRYFVFNARVHPKTAKDTPLDQFSEERAMAHVIHLATEIGFRQEGGPGLVRARLYLLNQVRRLQAKAGDHLRFEIDDAEIAGSFHLNFLGRSLTLAYQNLTNIVVRVSDSSLPVLAKPAILLNGHYDSPLGSQGAADCAACVATLLEGLRAIVEGGKVPKAPVIFLFNGGEEVFLKGVHGFVTQHPWAASVGAFLNYESGGSALPDLVIQSGPVVWPQRVYAETAVYPMATVISQDIFPHMPGDTDFRMFSSDFDDIPGIDHMMLLKGYYYHTPYDTPDRIMPGALQMRGDNLLPMLDGLAMAPELKNREQRRESARNGGANKESIPMYFDIFNKVIVFYPRPVAISFNLALLVLVCLVPFMTSNEQSGCKTVGERWRAMTRAAWAQALTWAMAFVAPVLVGILRVALSNRPLAWYSTPPTAFLMYTPASIAGILLPHIARAGGSMSRYKEMSKEEEIAFEWSAHWGGLLYLAVLAIIVTMCGAGGGFIGCWWSLGLLPSLFIYKAIKASLGDNNPIALFGYLLPPLLPCVYNLYFSAFFTQLMAEKMGATGSAPLPWGLLVPDVVLACFVGISVCITVAPFAPILSRWIGHPTFLRALLYVSLLTAAHTSSLFPYTVDAPKRVIVQRVYVAEGGAGMMAAVGRDASSGSSSSPASHSYSASSSSGVSASSSSPSFSSSSLSLTPPSPPSAPVMTGAETSVATADCNDAGFLLQHIPGLRRVLAAGGNESAEMTLTTHSNLRALYPVSDLIDRAFSFPAPLSARFDHPDFQSPSIRLLREEHRLQAPSSAAADVAAVDNATGLSSNTLVAVRRLHLELNAGSLTEVWCAVLNITGPVTAWSLTHTLPARERSRGGPPSLMVHYSGGGAGFKWGFWVELPATANIGIELAVSDHTVDEDVTQLFAAVPDWVALTVSSSYISHHVF